MKYFSLVLINLQSSFSLKLHLFKYQKSPHCLWIWVDFT